MKKYEIALCEDEQYENVTTYEYLTIKDMFKDLCKILNDLELCKELTRIELSTQDQDDEWGGNNNTFTFATIDIKEFLEGEKNNHRFRK